MSQKEIYRLDIKIGVNGDGETKKKLTATEKFAKQSEKRMKALDKIKASPTVRLKDKLSKPLDKVQSKISKFSKFAKSRLLAVATAGAIMAGGLGIGSAINTYMEYEQVLSNVKAVSSSTASEMKQLDSLALKLGAETSFSAKEAAQGIEELSKSGLTTKQILNGGLSGALDLAAAGELNLAEAAEIASTALNAFKRDNLNVSKAADILAGAANASATDVKELQYGLSMVSAVASSVGATFKDTSTALAVFAQNGLKGSDAGTSLKTMLMNLQPHTDAQYQAFEQLGLMTYNTDKAMKFLAKNGVKVAGSSFEAADKAMRKYVATQTKTKDGTGKFNKAYKRLTSQLGIAQSAFFDANGHLKSMSDIAGILQKSMDGLNDAQRLQVMQTMFGSDAIRAANIMFKEGAKGVTGMATAMDKVTAKETAAEKLNNLKGAVEELKGSIETMKIDAIKRIGPQLTQFIKWLTSKMPAVSDTIVGLFDKISKLVEGFNNLSPATKKFILGISLGGLALKPLIKVLGGVNGDIKGIVKLGSKVGTFFGLFGKATAAAKTVEGVGVAATVATGTTSGAGILGLAASFGPVLVAAAPWILGAAAVAGTGYLIYKGMTKEAVPAVDLFADKLESSTKRMKTANNKWQKSAEMTTTKISKATKEAVGAYMELDKEAEKSLADLYVNGTKITNKTVRTISDKYNEMGSQIKKGMDRKHQDMYNSMNTFFQKSNALSGKEETGILANMKKNNENKKREIDGYTKQINDILQKANSKKRPLNLGEINQIASLQEKMKTNAVQTLSKQEVETKIILERLKGYSGRVTAEQASSIIQNAETQRKGAVTKAEQQYNDTIANIIKLRDESHIITSEQADLLRKDAERQRDEAIIKAGELKQGVVDKLKEMTPEIDQEVNLQTGTMITYWDSFKSWWHNLWFEPKVLGVKVNEASSNDRRQTSKKYPNRFGYATGTNNATTGVHEVAEKGFEIVVGRQARLFNGGEKVISHSKSKKVLKERIDKENSPSYVEKPKMQFTVAKPALARTGGIDVNVGDIEVNNNFDLDVDVDEIVKETTNKVGRKLRQALKDIKK